MSLLNILSCQLPNVSTLEIICPIQIMPFTYLNDFNVHKKIKQLIFSRLSIDEEILQIIFRKLKNEKKQLESVHICSFVNDMTNIIPKSYTKIAIDEILPQTEKVFVWDFTINEYENLIGQQANINTTKTLSHLIFNCWNINFKDALWFDVYKRSK